LTSKVYQQTAQQAPDGEPGAQGGETADASGSGDGGPTVDADYKVVDDEQK